MDWQKIQGFPNYEISRSGHIRTIEHTTTYVTTNGQTRSRTFPSQMIKLQDLTGRGYLYAGLTDTHGIRSYHRVNRLMLITYIGQPPFPEAQALHTNDVKDDNDLTNLRWGTGSENSHDAVRNGIHPEARKTECINGHPFNEKNTYRRPDGKGRSCRQCALDNNRKRKGITTFRGLYKGNGESYVS